MKKYFMMAIAAAAITSCSQDEVMEVAEKQAINFGNTFVENATRAADLTYSTAKKPSTFLVYGNTKGTQTGATEVPIFKGVEVSSANTSADHVGNTYFYDAQYTQYWIEGNAYNFAAVVDGTVATKNIATNGLPTKIDYNAEGNKDLLYATQTATGAATRNEEVKFTFDHLLSKAMFTVKNTLNTNTENNKYTYRVSKVCITNAYPSGTYVIADKKWDVEGLTNNFTVEFGNVNNATTENADEAAIEVGKIAAVDQATSHYQRVIVPFNYTAENQLQITCQIETLLNGSVIDVEENHSIATTHKFEAGKAYNFIISLGKPGEPIMFSVEDVNAWDPATNGTDVNL